MGRGRRLGEELGGEGGEELGRGLRGGAFAPQVGRQGGEGEGGGDGGAAGGEPVAVRQAQQAAARVAMDIGALGFQLFCGNGLHVAIACGKEGRAGGSAV